MPNKVFFQSDTWKSLVAYAKAEGISISLFLEQLKELHESAQEEAPATTLAVHSIHTWFEELAITVSNEVAFKEALSSYLTKLFQLDFWEGGRTQQLFKLKYSDYALAKATMPDLFDMPGLYFWGHGQTLLYIGKTGKSFKSRFRRYLQGERSQTGLAENYGDIISHKTATVDDFPSHIREWYRNGYGNSTVRLDGAIKFAQYGLDGLWLSILPTSDPRFIEPLEEAIIKKVEEVLPSNRLDLLNKQHRTRKIKSSLQSDVPPSFEKKLPVTPPISEHAVSDKRTHLPMKGAYAFLERKGLYELKTEIRNEDVSYKTYTSSVRRGWIIKELKALGYYEEFKNKHWPFGNSPRGGHTLANRYERIYEEWRQR